MADSGNRETINPGFADRVGLCKFSYKPSLMCSFSTMRNLDLRLRSFNRGKKISQFVAMPLIAGFILTGLPVAVKAATYYNPRPYRSSERDYSTCAEGLLGTGLETEDATAACGGALYPRALSSCVTIIDSETELTAVDALAGCRRVRRPQELASCVVGITGISTEGTKPIDVLDYCRRSLLPRRFSNCVVGMSTQVADTSTTEMMTTCIAASNRPRQVLPSFIPQGEEVPLQPLPGTSATTDSTTGTTAPPAEPAPQPTTPQTPRPSVPALW